MVDVCTFCACAFLRKLTRTHTKHRDPKIAWMVVYLLRKRTVEVCLTYCQAFGLGSVRKNLAVHVSLFSIFTLSKS